MPTSVLLASESNLPQVKACHVQATHSANLNFEMNTITQNYLNTFKSCGPESQLWVIFVRILCKKKNRLLKVTKV